MIEIKTLSAVDDFKKVVEIQKDAWGFSEKDAEPHHLMTRVQKYGGLVQGLFLDKIMIGFTYALIGRWQGDYFIYSHMTAVSQKYQDLGYGFLLKKAQREAVLSMGYDIIRWNFDPLESHNSYFNIHRLGVVAAEYERNIYGLGESGLHQGLPTDRLIATWYLKSDRVIQRLNQKIPKIIDQKAEDLIGNFTGLVSYIEIPADIRHLKKEDMKKAILWRQESGKQFETAFANGFIVEEFVFSESGQRVFFKLGKKETSS